MTKRPACSWIDAVALLINHIGSICATLKPLKTELDVAETKWKRIHYINSVNPITLLTLEPPCCAETVETGMKRHRQWSSLCALDLY